MADVEGKKLTELRVIDLKTELERRGLDKTGNKAALLDRLAKAIIKEGGNPDECLIVPSGGVSRISPKKPVDTSIMIEDVLETEIRKEEFSNNFDGLDESSSNVADSNLVESNNDESVISISAQPDELEMDYQEPEPEPEQELEQEHEQEQEQELELEPEPELEIENEQEPTITTTSEEPTSEKKSFIHSEENSNVSAVETNGVDNEDSINLTIGEDEENLLAEESESNDRLKDGGAKKRLEDSNDSNSSSSSKKGDSKGSGRAEIGASNKEGSSSLASGPSTTGIKSKQEGEGCKSSDLAGKGTKKDDKDKTSTTSANASSRNLWVSGLSSTTRATDLKQIFSKYGKVVGAKVVTNARTPGARCYGYVTMSTSDDAEKCIEYLHRTELHGRVISVEKAKGDSQQSHNRKREPITVKVDKKDEKEKTIESESIEKEAESTEEEKKIDESEKDAENKEVEEGDDREKRENSVDNKDEGSLKDCDTRSNKSSSKKSDRERANSREDKKRSWDRSRTSRSRSRERPRRDNEERERQRFREKERLMREEKRRRREDMERQRAIEREAARLEREREKLRLERERIEQEKAELLRLERERQKVEREKLERERLELKRQQMRLEENRRPPAPGLKRTSSDRRDTRDTFEPDRKRIATEHGNRRHSPPERGPDRRNDIIDRVPDRRIDSSGPSRYEGRSKDMGMQKGTFKRNDFNARNNRDDHQFNDNNRGGRDNIVRRDNRPNQNSMDHRPVKDRYERPSFQRDRDVHRSDDNHRNSRDNHNRYDNSKPNNPRNNRYAENNRQTGWHSGPPSKPFNSHSVNNRNEQHQSGWNSRSSDTRVNNSRWNNSNNMGNNMGGHPRSQMYQGGGPNQSYGVQQGNSGSYDRFDPYKGSMQNMRKY